MENNQKKEIAEFYKQIFLDEKLKEKLREAAKKITNEEDLKKLIREEIMPLMKKYNVKFSEEELIAFEKETQDELSDELSDEDLIGITGGLSARPAIAGGLLALTLVAGGATTLGQTSHAAETAPESSISMQAGETKETEETAENESFDEDYDEDIDFESQEVAKWNPDSITKFAGFIDLNEGNTELNSNPNFIKNIASAKDYIGGGTAKLSQGTYFLKSGEVISIEDANTIRNFDVDEVDILDEDLNFEENIVNDSEDENSGTNSEEKSADDGETENSKIDFENELVAEWTTENIKNFVKYLSNRPGEYFEDNSGGHGLKDKYENLMNNLNNLREHITFHKNGNVTIDGEIADDLEDVAEDLLDYFKYSLDYDIEVADFDSTEEAEETNEDDEENEAEVEDDDDDDEEVSNEDEDDNEVEISDEIDDEVSNEDEDDNEVEISDEIDDEVSNEDNDENVEIEIFKEDLLFTPKTPHGSNIYNNFAECLNKLPQNYFDMTGAFNNKAPEDLKSNLYLACRYIHVTPEGKACADQDGKDVISSKVLETLVNFSRCNSGYKFDEYAASNDKLSEVVKFAMFNNPSSIEKLDSQQLNQWYVSYLELNQSGELDNLSPEIRDILDVFVLAGREAEIFSSEEIFSNNEEASFTTVSKEESSSVNEEASNTGNGQSSSILARAASATVSAIGSTIKGAGKLVGKIFSFWK